MSKPAATLNVRRPAATTSRRSGDGATFTRLYLPAMAVYSASKHAVNGLTRTAALEFAKQGVRVNAVAFGAIQTPMVDRFVEEAKTNNAQRDWLSDVHPIGRIGTATEAAQAVVAL